MAGRPKGYGKTGGRKKGTLNKLTSSVKVALESAFNELGDVSALVTWAKENPGAFYRLWAKMLPTLMSTQIGLDDSLGDDFGAAVRSKLAEIDANEHRPVK